MTKISKTFSIEEALVYDFKKTVLRQNDKPNRVIGELIENYIKNNPPAELPVLGFTGPPPIVCAKCGCEYSVNESVCPQCGEKVMDDGRETIIREDAESGSE